MRKIGRDSSTGMGMMVRLAVTRRRRTGRGVAGLFLCFVVVVGVVVLPPVAEVEVVALPLVVEAVAEVLLLVAVVVAHHIVAAVVVLLPVVEVVVLVVFQLVSVANL